MLQLRIIRLSAALLYAGALLAGIGGFGLTLLPLLLVTFMLWQILRHPGAWPELPADWLSREALVPGLMLLCSQLLLVVLLCTIGRGIGAVLGAAAGFSPLSALLISLLALPVLRYAPQLTSWPRLSRG